MKLARLFLTFIVVLLLGLSPSRVANADNENANLYDGKSFLSYIKTRCNQEGIPVKLVHNIIKQESNWRYPPKGEVLGTRLVESPTHDYGLMQVKIKTAQHMLSDVVGIDTLSTGRLMDDNVLNFEAGFRFLVWLIGYYHGNLSYAITAYNRGPGAVDEDLSNGVNPLNKYFFIVTKGVKFSKKDMGKIQLTIAKFASANKIDTTAQPVSKFDKVADSFVDLRK